MIRVCLVDDQTLVRQGIRSLLALADFAQRCGDTLSSAEINPLIALPREQGGCVAVDALVIGADRCTVPAR